MDPISIAVAFVLGFAARQVKLPPMVGFLVAGFLLQAFGVKAGAVIDTIADLGVTLLLFTIGLKLKLKSLARPEVWGGASVHALVIVGLFGLGFYALSLTGISVFAGLDLATAFLIAFALSFSSTVFAVKVLEEKGELPSLHGRTAIGILIMQDIFAVVFLTISTGKVPSIWAFALIGLIFVRPILGFMLNRLGHDELLPLFGLFSALAVGVYTFQLVGLKPDLGALIMGMLMATHKRASEIADSLFSFKEIFLVGFFLSIGLSEAPTLGALGIALLLVLLIPIKVAFFFLILTRFNLRARSSLLTAYSLANYSEFGLIVGAIGVENGWIGGEWLVIIAIALSISFVAASPLNSLAHNLYARWHDTVVRFETATDHPEEKPTQTGDAKIVIFGMGRVGTGAYDHIKETYGDILIGVESNAEKVEEHRAAGRNVVQGDATDSDFWERVKAGQTQYRLVMLAMPEHQANMYALEQITHTGYDGYIAAVCMYPDQVDDLREAGAHVAFNIYAEAGTGFAAHIDEQIQAVTGKAQSDDPSLSSKT
ncbi:MAG: cation:proton antiporter family protein [Pseudomonadota bacterium]